MPEPKKRVAENAAKNGENDGIRGFVRHLLDKYPDARIHKIDASLADLVVDVDTLVPDPDNANLHPDRSIEAILESLARYGQRKPVVVRREGMIITAGNGTTQAAKLLGWRKIAAAVQEFSDVEAKGFGVTDNRSAQHARWDYEVLGRLERLMDECGEPMIGWSPADILALNLEEGNGVVDTRFDGVGDIVPTPSEYAAVVLGDEEEEWYEEWQGMPEYVHEDLSPHRTIVVHFNNDEDVEEFSRRIGQVVTPNTKGLWFPKSEITTLTNRRYASES